MKKKKMLPRCKDGYSPNIFRRPDGSFFYWGDDGEIDVTPLNTTLSDDPSMWTYIDQSGKKYTPKLQPTNQGTIQQDNRGAGEKFWDNYIGELKYDLNNNRVVGGKYTLPAIGLGALGLYGASALGGLSYATPTLTESVGLVGKNIYGNAARDFVLSMLGGTTLDEASKLYTGNSWGRNFSNFTGGWIPELVADFTNPGYLLNGDLGYSAYNGARQLINSVPEYGRYLQKQITAPQRMRRVSDKMQDFYSSENANANEVLNRYKTIRDKLYIGSEEQQKKYDQELSDVSKDIKNTVEKIASKHLDNADAHVAAQLTKKKLRDDVQSAMERKGLRPDLTTMSESAKQFEKLMDSSFKILPDFSKMSAGDVVRFINKHSSNFKFNKNGERALLKLDDAAEDAEGLRNILAYSGYKVTPTTGMLEETEGVIPINSIFKTGDFQVPLFGTDQSVTGTINVTNPGKTQLTDYMDIIKSISDKKITPRQIQIDDVGYSASVPQAYRNALRKNIEYLTEMFPGSKAFGSSTTSAYAGTPHSTHDIDLLISDTDFVNSVEKQLGDRFVSGDKYTNTLGNGWRVSSKPNQTGYDDTFTHSLGEKYGEAGDIDFNIIYTDPDTGMASSTMGTRGLELYRQFFPQEYRQAVAESMRSGQPIVINKTPKELIDAYDPVVKTIADSFSSSKPKHVPRAEAHLTTTDPEYVEKALDLYIQEKLGGQAQRLPITRDMFNDVEQNRRIFKELGYKGVDEETVVKDPAKMKNLVDYWYIHNGTFGRGVSTSHLNTTNMSQEQALDASFRQWVGSGGNVNGAGLNTVTLGDSGYGDIYGYIQPKLQFDQHSDAEQIIKSAKRQLGHYQYQFTDQEKKAIQEIVENNGQHITMDKTNSPAQLLDNLSSYYSSDIKNILQEISDKLGIRALSRGTLFGGGRYNSMTGDVAASDAVMYSPRLQQEMPVSDVRRDLSTATQNSTGSAQQLKDQLMKEAENRSDDVRQSLAKQNKFYKELVARKLGSGMKYDDMTQTDISRLARRKIKKINPSLANRTDVLNKVYLQARDNVNETAEKVITTQTRLNKANRYATDSKDLIRFRQNVAKKIALAGAATLTIGGGLGALLSNAHTQRGFHNSPEFSEFLKTPAADSEDMEIFEKEYQKYLDKYKSRIKQRRQKTLLTAKTE